MTNCKITRDILKQISEAVRRPIAIIDRPEYPQPFVIAEVKDAQGNAKTICVGFQRKKAGPGTLGKGKEKINSLDTAYGLETKELDKVLGMLAGQGGRATYVDREALQRFLERSGRELPRGMTVERLLKQGVKKPDDLAAFQSGLEGTTFPRRTAG